MTAEQLMRSRFSAYLVGEKNYLLQTWHPSTRPEMLNVSEPGLKWTRLEIVESSAEAVEFIARYKINGKAGKLHEKSRFLQEGVEWFYLAGEIVDT